MCEFDRISSKKIVIDPYRGGDDIGKTKDNLIEKDFNLEVIKFIGYVSLILLTLNHVFYDMDDNLTVMLPMIGLTIPIVFYNDSKK